MNLKDETQKNVDKAEVLLERKNKINKFEEKYEIMPTTEVREVAFEMYRLAEYLPEITIPKNQDELIQSELGRRMKGEASYLEYQLKGQLYDFNTVIDIFGIPREDIDALRPWLETNKERTKEAIERLFRSRDIEGYELSLSVDVPSIRRQAEEFAGAHVQRYHQVLGKFLQGLTDVGGFMRDINAVPSTSERSYFNSLTNTLAIGIPAICYSTEDGTLHIRDRELIRLYGHEGMGHALNFMVTRSNDLPHLLTETSALTVASGESVAQHFEKVLLEDLRESPETQKKLGIEHRFDEIYQEAKATEQLEKFKRKLFQYSVFVMGDETLGDPKDSETLAHKTRIIDSVSIDPNYARGFVQNNRYNFDSEGNLSPRLVGELRYCARPVQRAIEEFSRMGLEYNADTRNMIDATLLKGLWTPTGFVDNARMVAEMNTC